MSKIMRVFLSTALAVVTVQSAHQVYASGFALIENSASGQGEAFAGAAAVASDASTIWFNPAGMMRLGDDQMVVAGHYIKPKSKFTNANSTTAAAVGGTAINRPRR